MCAPLPPRPRSQHRCLAELRPQKWRTEHVCFGVVCSVAAGDWSKLAQLPLTNRALSAAILPAQSPAGLWAQFCLPLCSLSISAPKKCLRLVLFLLSGCLSVFSPFMSIRYFSCLTEHEECTDVPVICAGLTGSSWWLLILEIKQFVTGVFLS